MAEDNRWTLVNEEQTKAEVWIATPAPPAPGVTYNLAPPAIALLRTELLDKWLPKPAPPLTETGKIVDGPVNVRSGPGKKYAVVGSLSTGASFTAYLEPEVFADTHLWRKLVGQRESWIAETFTSLHPIPPPPPPPPPPLTGKSTIGIHVADTGTIGDFRGVIERAAKTEHPVPVVVVVNDSGLIDFVKRTSPATITVFRGGVNDQGDPSPFGPDGSGDGYGWVNKMWSAFHSAASMANFHQMYNEVTFGGNLKDYPGDKQAYARNVAKTEIDMLKRANEIGIRLAVGNYTAGVPDPDLFGLSLAPVWDFAQAYGHAALFHWYSQPGTRDMVTGREFMLDRLLRYFKAWPKLQILIGEVGLYDSPRWTGPHLWQEMAEGLRPHVQAGQKVVAMSWTIKAQNDIKWKDDDYTHRLGEYETLLKAGRLS